MNHTMSTRNISPVHNPTENFNSVQYLRSGEKSLTTKFKKSPSKIIPFNSSEISTQQEYEFMMQKQKDVKRGQMAAEKRTKQ